MSETNIPRNSNGMKDSQKRTDPPVPSHEQHSSKSSLPSIKPKEANSSTNFSITVGDPLRFREEAGNNLIKIAEETSGAGLSEESKGIIQNYMQNASMGFLGVIPMKCRGHSCSLPGTLVRTNTGDKRIEDLDEKTDLIVGWEQNIQAIRGGFKNGNIKGYKFTKHKRMFTGSVVTITTPNRQHEVTEDHFSIARWADEARDLYCVYLMRKGDFFRVGKTRLFSNNLKGNFNPAVRAHAKKAEALWILGLYQTEVQALLHEEIFSLKFSVPKSLFISTPQKTRNASGLYKWVIQEELDKHHASCAKPIEHFKQCLESIGLDIRFPLWQKGVSKHPETGESTRLGLGRIIHVRAVNLIEKYMKVPCIPLELKRSKYRAYKTQWEILSVKKRLYTGEVWSLGVDKYNTYFANSIATHNCPFVSSCPLALAGAKLPVNSPCPVEQNMIVIWVNKHLKALGIDNVLNPESSFDMDLLYELAGQELIRWRCGVHLSDEPSLVTRELVNSTITGVDIFADVINPVLDVLERAGKNINKIREALVATREAQIKAGQESRDPSQKAAELRQKAQEVLKQKREYLNRLQSPEHIKDAEIIRIKSSEE